MGIWPVSSRSRLDASGHGRSALVELLYGCYIDACEAPSCRRYTFRSFEGLAYTDSSTFGNHAEEVQLLGPNVPGFGVPIDLLAPSV